MSYLGFPPGVDFTNILRPAFKRAGPKSTKNIVKLLVFFAPLGSARIKAVLKMLVKSTLGLTLKLFTVYSQFVVNVFKSIMKNPQR